MMSLYDLGTVAARRPRRVLLIWLAVAVVVITARAEWGGDPVNSFDIPGAESQRAIDLIEERFPGLTGTTSRIVFHSDIGGLDDPALASAIHESIDRARQLDDVAGSPTRCRPAPSAPTAAPPSRRSTTRF